MQIPFLQEEYKSEFNMRLEKIIKAMNENSTDAILIASSTNLYYISGTIFRGYTYITKDKKYLFFLVAPSKGTESKTLFNIHKPELIPDILTKLDFPVPGSVGLEFDDLYYNDVIRLQKLFPHSRIVNGSAVLRKARLTKTEFEIQKIREDGMHQARAYSHIPKVYREGMTDLELQIEIERILRLEGNLGYLRVAGARMELNMGSIIAGENADAPSPYDFALGGAGVDPSLPVGANGSIILPGTSVMVDMNGGFNGYQSDMTRTWRLGELTDIAYKAHDCSIKILRTLEKFAFPGTPISHLYSTAKNIVEKEGLSDFFMGHSSKAKFIGHGVGIELNEAPVIIERNNQLLEENMVIALEPKFVIPHVGALGIENTYCVREHGLENLTVFPDELKNLV